MPQTEKQNKIKKQIQKNICTRFEVGNQPLIRPRDFKPLVSPLKLTTSVLHFRTLPAEKVGFSEPPAILAEPLGPLSISLARSGPGNPDTPGAR